MATLRVKARKGSRNHCSAGTTTRQEKVPGTIAPQERLQVGTTWRGWGHYTEPSNFFPGFRFTTELAVTERERDSFKAIYKSDHGRTEWEVEGTISDNEIHLE